MTHEKDLKALESKAREAEERAKQRSQALSWLHRYSEEYPEFGVLHSEFPELRHLLRKFRAAGGPSQSGVVLSQAAVERDLQRHIDRVERERDRLQSELEREREAYSFLSKKHEASLKRCICR